MSLFEKQLKALIQLFNETDIKYAIIGGLAVLFYGRPRFTADIDVNILIDRDKIDFFLAKAKKRGFKIIPKNSSSFIKETGVIPLFFRKGNIGERCDIIIAESAIEYAGINRARIKKIGSVKAKVVTAEDLVIHKITSNRPRDIEDLRGILLRQKGKLDVKYILSWLNKIDKVNRKSKLKKLFKKLFHLC
jgi:predicted nucleotidyltransferase